MSFAVITTGGKQYVVSEGQSLKVEKLDLEVGATVEFAPLLVSDAEAVNVRVGAPTVQGAKVIAKVSEQGKADKISVIKFKPKVRYRRNVGHRQPFTKITIESIA